MATKVSWLSSGSCAELGVSIGLLGLTARVEDEGGEASAATDGASAVEVLSDAAASVEVGPDKAAGGEASAATDGVPVVEPVVVSREESG